MNWPKRLTALAVRESELAEAQRRAERAEAEIVLKDNALADARAAWQADTDTRITAVATQAANELEHSRDAWQMEEKTRINELETRAETRMAQARESWRHEMRDALSKAQSSWNAGEADRLAAAEKQWQAQADTALAEAQAGVDTLRNESEIELRRLRDELAQTRAIIAERDAELTRMRSAREVEAAVRPDLSDAELRRIRDALVATQATLAEREQDLVKARTAIEAAYQREQELAEAPPPMAEAAWQAKEAKRLAAAEKQWQSEHGKHLAEARARYEAAEFALADMGKRAREREGATDKLRNEVAMLQSILDSRELELSRIRGTFEPDRQVTPDPITARRRAAAESLERQAAQSGRNLVRDAIVVMGGVMALALIYFRIEAYLPEYLWLDLPAIATEDSGPAVGSAAPEKPPPLPASLMEHETAIVTRDVNLRAEPSTAADVIATLPRGLDVETTEHRGGWTRVQTRGKGDPSKLQQGWIYDLYLKLTGAHPEKSAITNHGQRRSALSEG